MHGLDLSRSGYRQLAGPCESGYEPSSFHKMRGISCLADELLVPSRTLFHAVSSSSFYYYYYYWRRVQLGLQDWISTSYTQQRWTFVSARSLAAPPLRTLTSFPSGWQGRQSDLPPLSGTCVKKCVQLTPTIRLGLWFSATCSDVGTASPLAFVVVVAAAASATLLLLLRPLIIIIIFFY